MRFQHQGQLQSDEEASASAAVNPKSNTYEGTGDTELLEPWIVDFMEQRH